MQAQAGCRYTRDRYRDWGGMKRRAERPAGTTHKDRMHAVDEFLWFTELEHFSSTLSWMVNMKYG